MLIIVIGFSGCSSKDIKVSKKVELSQEELEDEDFDDFEDEMEIKEVYDPLELYNRSLTIFNDKLYENVFKPVNRGYLVITTIQVRQSIDRAFKNLAFPMRFVNNILQMKFHYAFEETGRFVVNSTAGVFGLFDPARNEMGLMAHNEDFGQTLGFYGLGSGPHIVLPVFGPSNLRDFTGYFGNAFVSPIDYTARRWPTITQTWGSYLGVKTVEKFNEVSLFSNTYDNVKKDAVDLYPFLRDMYEQQRDKMIEE